MIYDQVIKHIFATFGTKTLNGDAFPLIRGEFKLDKKFSIEMEDGEILNRNVWGVSGKVGNSTIEALLADVSVETDDPEYVLIFRMDDLSIYALKLSLISDTTGGFVACDNDQWAELSTLMLARLLVGFEQLNELLIDYKILVQYQELYKYLISFLNYEENLSNN